MKRKKRSKARALWLAIIGTIFGVGLLLFPLKGRGAGPEDKATPAKASEAHAAATKNGAAKKHGKHGKDAPAEPAPATTEEPAPEPAPAPKPEELTTIPIGKGLPVNVSIAVFFLEITAFDDTKGEYEATIDTRLQWVDPRLTYPVKETLRGYREFIGKAAEEQLGKMWSPSVDAKNRLEVGDYVGRRLRIFPNGRVESITRTSGKYKVPVNAEAFPFDRQKLAVDFIVREETVDDVLLRFDKEDVDFRRAAQSA